MFFNMGHLTSLTNCSHLTLNSQVTHMGIHVRKPMVPAYKHEHGLCVHVVFRPFVLIGTEPEPAYIYF